MINKVNGQYLSHSMLRGFLKKLLVLTISFRIYFSWNPSLKPIESASYLGSICPVHVCHLSSSMYEVSPYLWSVHTISVICLLHSWMSSMDDIYRWRSHPWMKSTDDTFIQKWHFSIHGWHPQMKMRDDRHRQRICSLINFLLQKSFSLATSFAIRKRYIIGKKLFFDWISFNKTLN